jgi:DNA-binding CsgD family transcriptional regulator
LFRSDGCATVVDLKEFIGRALELEQLQAFLSVSTDALDTLLLVGQAGMGKTTLWTLGLALAAEQGYRVLSCRAAGAEARLAYAGLGDLIRGVDEAMIAGLPPPQRRALEIALLRAESEGEGPSEQAVALASLSLLHRLGAESPVLVAVDDAHWLDAPSAAVLEFVARRVEREPAKVLAATRAEPDGADRSLVSAAVRDERSLVLTLGPLTRAELHHLVQERLGFSLSPPALRAVHDASGGNPFFALEIARTLENRSTRVEARLMQVPESLEELLGERIDPLPAGCQELMLIAAALRRPTTALLVSASGKADIDDLDAAVKAGVLEVEHSEIRFTHPLFASAVYTRASPGARRRVHSRLGEVVQDEEERARHLALGAAGPAETIAAALERAAEGAAARGAPTAAAELAELSVESTPSGSALDAARRSLAAGAYAWHAGESARARAIFERLVEELPPGPLRADAYLHLAFTREDDDAVVAEICRQALADAEGDPFRTSEIRRVLGFVSMVMGDLAAALEHGRLAVAAAEESGDAHQLAGTLSFDAVFRRFAELAGDDELARALELESRLDNVLPIYSPTIVSGLALMYDGALDAALARLEQARATIDEQGNEVALAQLVIHLCELEWRSGNWPLAERYASEGLQLTEQLGMKQSHSSMLYCTALVAAGFGRAEEARRAAEEGARLADEASDFLYRTHSQTVLGFLELSIGDSDAACTVLAPLLEQVVEAGWREPAVFYSLWPDAIEVLIRAGEVDRAVVFLSRFEELYEVRPTGWAEGIAARSRALLEAARGDLAAATEHAERAARAHTDLGQPFEQARTLLIQGLVHRRAKHRRLGRAALEEAAVLFESLGARLWVERAREELRRIGGRSSPVDELTPTERRVAERAAAGETNREIATNLFMSLKTVEANLSRVYRKLGISSRRDLRRGWANGTSISNPEPTSGEQT